MKVLIVGSLNHLDPALAEPFREACRQIGVALAADGIEIVIGSEGETTADRYVLEGVASVQGRHTVWLVRPESNATPYLDSLPPERIQLFPRIVRGTWSAGRVPQILAADAVLLIGGKGGGLMAGYVAPALEKPVLSVASFAGAAGSLWNDLEPYYRQLGPVSNEIDNLNRGWSPRNADLVASALRELVERRVFKTKPRIPFGLYMLMLISCLVAWVMIFTNPFSPAAYSFFSLLAIAGLLGTILRNNLRMIFDPTAKFSWNELLIEIGAGLLLGFALALLYLVGALTIQGSTNVLIPSDPAGFQRVAVVMTLLGLGGGLMIEQAAERVRGWFINRLDSIGR